MSGSIVDVTLLNENVRKPAAEPVKVMGVTLTARTRRAIVLALVKKAEEGDVHAIDILFDRIYGRPGVIARVAATADSDVASLDMRQLNEEEMKKFADLFEKCIVKDGSAGGGRTSKMVRSGLAVPAGPGRIRTGDTESDLVAQTDRSGERSIEA